MDGTDYSDNDSYSADGAFRLSCESLPFEDSHNDVVDETSHCGVLPYQFEPYEDDVEDSENEDETVDSQADRIGNTDWCTCGNCYPMSMMTESVCCREINQVNDIRREAQTRRRYVAYRQLVRWCFDYLDRKVRVPIPSCVVSKVRRNFPGEDDEYTGFQHAA
ncbi:uncharacterized protein LOC132560050 [Ylistrum balloti]|uniref:uncharacterized protein LOC132560050 n=1 Tax=Ylistrum balloti TaxID=509963 RepID=UPI002905A61D|nr:uncharacterized protein LOC132560050 [Ylistrum balloti]